MKSSSADIPVHDIAPLLEIYEYSIYWFMVLIVMAFVMAFVMVRQMRMKKKSKEINARSERYERFARIDMRNPKAAAYEICKQGSFFAHDNEETRNAYQILFKCLEPYKYARTVDAIDEETLMLYASYQKRITA